MIIDDYELDRDDEYLESLDVVIEDLETSSSSESDKSGLVTDISTSEVEINDDKSYDFADEDDIDSLKLDGEKYDTDEDGLEEFVKDIEDEDDVYIELTLNSKNKITKAVAYTCSTEDVTIDDIDDMEDDEISGYEYSSSTSVNIVDGDSSITSTSKLEKAVEDDGKEIKAVLVINDDDEIVAITGYVSAINDAKVDTFKVKDDPEDCYLILDISTSSVKYYFDDEWSIKDIESLEDDFKDDYDKATITLTDEGKIEDEGLDLR